MLAERRGDAPDSSEGRLVELHGLPETLDASDVIFAEAEPHGDAGVRANGKVGRLLGFDYGSGKHIVETVDGVRLLAAEGNLRPRDLTVSGVDAVWPHGVDDSAHFVAKVTEALATRDHCVVQMFVSDASARRALDEALTPLMNFKSMRRELEPAYLGRGHACKAAWLSSLADAKVEPASPLDEFDLLLSQLTQLLMPLAPVALHFMAYSRTSGLVRMPFQNQAEESRMRSYEVDDDDIAEGLLDEHVQFLKRRQLCMMLICRSDGGELKLFPKDDWRDTITLPTSQGQLVVFRHDRMGYSYVPSSSEDLVLQAWVLTEPDRLENLKLETADPGLRDEAIGLLVGPSTPYGARIDTVGLASQLPGWAEFEESYWSMVAAGTDAVTKTPFNRFDMDLYYMPSDVWVVGATYTVHGGYVCSDIYALDNTFFHVQEDEASTMAPAQRCLLERGYEAIYRSGLRRKTLKGKHMGIFCGHSGDDWGMNLLTLSADDRFKHSYESRIWGSLTGRLAHIFGMKGPQTLVDTACSSALVAYGVGHTMMRKSEGPQNNVGVSSRLDDALMMGANMIPGPGNYINLCGPHMLSSKGRCFTFDVSADGFCRGEGIGAFVVKNQAVRTEDTICTMIGACLNQDGRSASMTAPNGPAQQECIRGSMREAGLRASEVTCAELHGTGTALGDPIEVGSLKGVMQDRVVPLMQSSAKTHMGHLEASAGIAGVIKCMLMSAACTASPNCHLASLNPHLDITGYPTCIATDLCDWGANSGYAGVSSFGFGGANSRADVFSRAIRGPHATGPIDVKRLDYITVTCPFDEGPMHYLDGRAVPTTASARSAHGPYHVDSIRDEFATYDYSSGLYAGAYQINPPDEDFEESLADPVYIVGSWDSFGKPRELDIATSHEGVYSIVVALGETRHERFHFRVAKDAARSIFPVAKNGSMHTRVVGPDVPAEGHNWVIDGRDDQLPAGTPFRVFLQWGKRPVVRWEQVASDAPEWSLDLRHTYAVQGSWTAWQSEPMFDASTPSSPNLWQTRLRIGLTGVESFRFVRDEDPEQLIYPLRNGGGQGVPACGPDDFCCGRSWSIRGRPGEIISLALQVVDAHVAVSIERPGHAALLLRSIEGPRRHVFHIAGSFTAMAHEEMEVDDDRPGVYRYRGQVGPTGQEHFTIAVDGNSGLRLYPEVAGSYPGESFVRGPGKVADDQVFTVFALIPGAEFEIIVDRHAADKRKVVDVRWHSERFDYESMRAAAYEYIHTSPSFGFVL
mmetsp:Transcript_33691/g.96770  ORF Transcript_33691/g.96770 Transcript_33691/m.96770 type:complete len:1254 (+) Transcript_33691:86-3847(+)